MSSYVNYDLIFSIEKKKEILIGCKSFSILALKMQAAKKKINHLVFEAFELSSWKNVSSGRAISN